MKREELMGLSMTYHKVLTFLIFPLLLLGSVSNLVEIVQEQMESGGSADWLSYCPPVIFILLYTTVIVGLFRRSRVGLLFLGILFDYIIIRTVKNMVISMLHSAPRGLLLNFITLAVYVLWAALTYIYFRKRKGLFGIQNNPGSEQI